MPELIQAEILLDRLPSPPREHERPHPQQAPAANDSGVPGAAPRPEVSPASEAGDPSSRLPVAAGELVARVRAAVSAYAYGETLPPTRKLGREVGAPYEHVRAALDALEAAGEVAVRQRVYRYRLDPGQLHPQDVEFDRAVRGALTKRVYAPGAALPVGLLGRRHGVASQHLARACRHLIADGLVAHRDGPAGPGYYVTTTSPSPIARAAATRKEESHNRV
ncbi:regulatory protein, gntR family [Streptomyces sp. MnatMP-M77]|uniref:GntR family transcriptional regulator n=1 Tax=unclassified Streptomyces TaxID=2593676 RepID=UPI0008059B76|nr:MULTISPECIES: GntR family transcriptional regulator [unclassified Streptomyces]MYT82384.1 GntR family transcriptional regulator [Streptomyces sp. SID8364]SBU96407.1 regulatory protein, gntR family [Streptomyces sp. MnatMP-M77]SCD38009.1 regulatory protein, gntR family [Streptomyces sp. OspMP-M43]